MKTNQIGKTATTVHTDETGVTHVVYHNTKVVSFNPDQIILNSGGWETTTTKRRMNQTSNQFNLGYSVYQKGGMWFVDYNEKTYTFYDGMRLTR